jgi:hypothetical protein
MSAIDVGSGALSRSLYCTSGKTRIDKGNPANASGFITSVELYGGTGTGVKVGTFYQGEIGYYACRDYAVIGDLEGGAKRTFSGLHIEVEAGDLIGVYMPDSGIRYNDGGVGHWSLAGDHMSDGENYYNENATAEISTYGTGVRIPVVITQQATDIMENGATSNGNIENDGGLSVTQHGVLWKKGADPVNLAGADAYTQEGAGSEGSFTSTLSPLAEDTLYYYRAYATNSEGDGYGAAQSFKTEYRARSIII